MSRDADSGAVTLRQLRDDILAAHETIGRLRYLLENNGIEIPGYLARKIRDIGMTAILATVRTRNCLGDVSPN